MDFLKAEVAKKKALIEEREKKLAQGKGFVKRKAIADFEREKYYERCTKKSKPEAKSTLIRESTDETQLLKDSKQQLSEKEVIKRLRERGEPIKLFGESPHETYIRLRHLEMQEPSASKSQTDFKTALDKIDQEYLNAMMMELHGDAVQSKPMKELSSLEEMKEKCNGISNPDIATEKLYPLVRIFFTWLFEVWQENGEQRFRENERDLQVKLEKAKIKQAESYLKPLFKSLKKKTLEEAILRPFGEIAGALLERNYIVANDAYLKTAIGNAAWPIGVTMVGIHARTGREKLFAHNVAHVLNDEVQRKYLQAIKRLMTFAQRHFPTDPSKSVEYNA